MNKITSIRPGPIAIIALIVMTALAAVIFPLAWGVIPLSPSFLENFTSNWLSTLLGVVVGIPIALFVSHYQEHVTEEERRRKILSSLAEELASNKEQLKWLVDNKILDKKVGVVGPLLKIEMWNAFSDGGELQWIKDTKLLALISDSYYSIRAVMNLADRYYDTLRLSVGMQGPDRVNEVWITLGKAIEYANGSLQETIGIIEKEMGAK